MRGFSRVFLVGRLGTDPETKVTAGGQTYTRFRLGVQQYTKSDPSQDQLPSRTDWHRVTVWGKRAELCQRWLSKGAPVAIEGRLSQFRPPSRDSNQNQPTAPLTSIVADEVHFLPSPRSNPIEASAIETTETLQ
jgi:single-strand DNA-binding protein